MNIFNAILIGLCITLVTSPGVSAKKIVYKSRDALFDPARPGSKIDYACTVSLIEKIYSKDIPGDLPTGLSDKKWYFKVAFFKGDVLKKVFNFPAALLLTTPHYKNFKPRHLSFIPRSSKGWNRELLSVENGNLFKYNLWAEQDDKGNFKRSVDLGKRIPLFVTGTIDASYQPRGDASGSGDIYFKANKQFKKWNARTETVENLDTDPNIPAPTNQLPSPAYIIVEKSKRDKADTIDPLASDETKLKSMLHTEALDAQRKLMRQLKLVMREKGVMSTLTKPLATTTVDMILSSLEHGLIAEQPATGKNIKSDAGKKIITDYGLPYNNYLMLLQLAEREELESKMEDPGQLKTLTNALKNFPKEQTLDERKHIKDEIVSYLLNAKADNWDTWFADTTKNTWRTDLAFRYLITLEKEEQAQLLENSGVSSKIKKINLQRVIDLYKFYSKK